ncbi:MAG: hypothetical protein Q9219_007053 [cf. Caloplaca sp. 3 TL-2023]
MHDIRATYKYWCALNVGTDLIVMALPLFMIQGLRLRNAQKAILAGVFSVGSVVAVFDILRTVESLQSGTFSGVALWSSLEVTVAVIVAALPLYRVLLTPKGRSTLKSRLSIERYKDMDGSPESTERRFFETKALPGKRSVRTFRDDLETQDSEFSKYSGAAQRIPQARLSS